MYIYIYIYIYNDYEQRVFAAMSNCDPNITGNSTHVFVKNSARTADKKRDSF